MNEPFLLPVVYQGTEYEFKARFERYGYSHRIAVLVDELTYTFEPDEEGGYRALAFSGETASLVRVNTGLLVAIAKKLVSLSA
jgi:hypothetical protein